ncbi:hypothetical protein RI543_002573 [Arxiozyma heterogenica]|uniref:Uncharacterized protein n=1 Tax=Arxiozyma heterogenica TaxID=278026 RepID=A0AAN7WMW1_9SACH|nr:hypothetical protein RI543_002573 [Kazachstania heterogenica]
MILATPYYSDIFLLKLDNKLIEIFTKDPKISKDYVVRKICKDLSILNLYSFQQAFGEVVEDIKNMSE